MQLFLYWNVAGFLVEGINTKLGCWVSAGSEITPRAAMPWGFSGGLLSKY